MPEKLRAASSAAAAWLAAMSAATSTAAATTSSPSPTPRRAARNEMDARFGIKTKHYTDARAMLDAEHLDVVSVGVMAHRPRPR